MQLVKVVAAEAVVARGRENLKHAVADLEDRNVERAAAEVVDQDLLVVLFVHAVGKRCRRRLVDDAQDFKTGDAARVLGRLALAVGEIRGNGDDRLRHGFAEVRFRVGLELLQDHRGDFLRGVVLAVDVHLARGAHVALDRRDRAVGVRDGLALCDLADHALAVFKRNHGRRGAHAFGIGDDDRFAAFKESDAGVRRAEVDADNFAHKYCPPTILSISISNFKLKLKIPIS